MTLIFLDAEFTGLPSAGCLDSGPKPKLISLGLVSEDGQEFYAEASGWKARECNAFVKKNVLPLLSGPRLEPAELRSRLWEYLSGIPGQGRIACDYGGDWRFLLSALGGALPGNVDGEYENLGSICEGFVYEGDVEKFFGPGNPRHNALNDARALRLAYMEWRAGQPAA